MAENPISEFDWPGVNPQKHQTKISCHYINRKDYGSLSYLSTETELSGSFTLNGNLHGFRTHLKKSSWTPEDLQLDVWQIKNEKEHSCSLTDAKYTSKDPIQKVKREVSSEDITEDSSDAQLEGKKLRRSAEDQVIVKKANERRFIEIIFVISRPVVDKYNDDNKVGFQRDWR